jgi:hypothetical protein
MRRAKKNNNNNQLFNNLESFPITYVPQLFNIWVGPCLTGDIFNQKKFLNFIHYVVECF